MKIPTIEENELEEYLGRHQSPLFIEIWMNNCPPCNMMGPKLKAAMQDYQDEIEVHKVKVTEDSPLMDQFDIEAIPTLLLFKNGTKVNRLEGLVHSQELEEAFKELSNKNV